MKPHTQLTALAFSALLMGGCATETAIEEHAASAAHAAELEEFTTPVFENQYVRVVRFDVAPGASLPEHEGGKRVVYSLSDYQIDWREGGEDQGPRTWKAGDVHTHDAKPHSLTNTGDTAAQFVVFERKDGAPAADASDALPDAAFADPGHAGLLLDDESFRVVRVSLEPGDAQPVHEGGPRVVYSLSDYTIDWTEGDAAPVRKSWSTGQAHWHEAGPHSASNVGETTAEWLIVTLK